MKNSQLSLLFFCFSLSFSFGQTLHLSEDIQIPENEPPLSMARSSDGTYFIETGMRKFNYRLPSTINIFYREGSTEKFKVKLPEETRTCSDIFTLEDELHQLVHFKDHSAKKIIRKLIKINLDGSTNIVNELDESIYHSSDVTPKNHIYFSPDSSFIATIEVVDLDKKNQQYRLKATILNEDFEIINQREYVPERSNSQRLTHFFDAKISNDGNLYFAQKIFGEKFRDVLKGSNNTKANYTIELSTLRPDGEIESETLQTDQNFLFNVAVFITDTGKPFIVSDIKAGHEYNSQTLGIRMHSPFTSEEMELKEYFFSEDLKEKMKGTTSNNFSQGGDFYAINLEAISQNNEISFYIENRYKFNRYLNELIHLHYVSESAVVFRVTNDGEFINEFFVPKYYINPIGFVSAMLQKIEGKEYLIYQDLKKNLKNKMDSFEGYQPASSGYTNRLMAIAYQDDDEIGKYRIGTGEEKLAVFFNNLSINEGDRVTLPIVSKEKRQSKPTLALGTIEIDYDK